ncbi:MAG: alpha/beta hydrolase [Gammaproteobacteria bacterium]|nr:alpha/beta hydrolase [Gammaproteobacteria bacterium]
MGSPASEERYFESGGVPIRFLEEGDGPPVVLIHGFTSSSESWTEIGVVPRLSGGFRTIAMDCRGHGRSGKPHDPSAYGMHMVRDLVAGLDALDIEEAHLVGYSMGAEIALRTTVAYPQRVRSLIIGGSGWSEAHESETYRRIGESLRDHGSIGPAVRWMNAQSPAGPFTPPTGEQIAEFDGFLRSQDVAALSAVAASMHEIVNLSRDQVAAIGVAVLGITGSEDPEQYNLEKLVGVTPRYTLQVIAGKDHGEAMFDPRFVGTIAEFLERTVTPTRA